MKTRRGGFGQAIVAITIVGAIVLIIMMLVGINYFSKNNVPTSESPVEVLSEEPDEIIEEGQEMTSLIIIKAINEGEVEAINMNDHRNINKTITDTTIIKDTQGKSIPQASLSEGDIVEITYMPTYADIIEIIKPDKVWKDKLVSNVKIHEQEGKIYIGNNTYDFDDALYVGMRNIEEGSYDAQDISSGDIVTLQGIEDKVYSIIIEEEAAGIKIVDLPTQEGMLELDRKTMIPLNQINETIKVTPGVHKLVIEMKGYETIVDQIELNSGEVYQYSVKDAKEAYCNITVAMNDTNVDYTIKIGDESFGKADKISVLQGTYDVTVSAEGYKSWTRRVKLETSSCVLQVSLASLEDEENQEDEVVDSELNKEDNVVDSAYTISISTDPVGAKVYIDGVQKGITPYKTTLPLGSYTILLEKEDYEIYSTSIILDNSSDQNSFLYVLTPES